MNQKAENTLDILFLRDAIHNVRDALYNIQVFRIEFSAFHKCIMPSIYFILFYLEALCILSAIASSNVTDKQHPALAKPKMLFRKLVLATGRKVVA